MLAACGSVGPDYRRPTTVEPSAFRQLEGGTVEPAPPGWKLARHGREGAGRDAGADPGPGWWRHYADPTLDALAAAIEPGNQDIAAAQARLRQSLALLDATAAARRPVVGANLSASRSRSVAAQFGGGQVQNAFRGGLSLGWEIDLWGRIARSVEANEAFAAASAADLAGVRLSIQAALVQAYVQLRSADALRRLLDSTVQGYEQSLLVSRNRYDAGVAPRSDVTQAETQLRSVQAQLIDVGIQRAQLEHAIAVLLGRSPSSLSIPETDRVVSLPSIPVGLPSELLERRPDVAAAERRAAAANAQIGVARAALFPSLQLGASAGTAGSTLGDLLSLPNRVWSIGPALAQTLFDGGQRSAQVAQAQAAFDASAAAYRQTVLGSFQEVEDALVSLRLLAREEAVQQLAVQAAGEALEQVTNQYRAGTVSILNLITAQAALLSARRSLVDLRTRQLLASVQLARATGGGW
ncbi:MAG: efflux transporter outer membrane subunit [Lautropia sp.]